MTTSPPELMRNPRVPSEQSIPDSSDSGGCADATEVRASFRSFAVREVAPYAALCDEEARIPESLIARVAEHGLFGAALSEKWGGGGLDALAIGVLHEELGRVSASVQGLINVNNMGAQSIARWGTPAHQEQWLPRLARGEQIVAIAITEPDVGSDAGAVETRARKHGDTYVLDGQKRWISFGQIADVFIVLASSEEGPTAFLVDRDHPGFSIVPLEGMLGCRGYMLAELSFKECRIPANRVLGRPGLGFSHVLGVGLDVGRFCISWGCVGLAQACLDASLAYARSRHQFGRPIGEHQLVQAMLTGMIVSVQAGRQLCVHAADLRQRRDRLAKQETLMAKYFTSTAAARAAVDAVQIHGANGCGSEYPVQRYFRDSKIMELIEGSTQIHQALIAQTALRDPPMS